MKENFDACIAEVLRHEGGYVDDPRDAGGATNMGITQSTLSAWRGRSVTKAQVKALTKAEAIDIYRANYWNAVKGDDLPGGLDMVTFDACVNSGASRASKWTQQAVGAAADGKIGPNTLAAARQADQGAAINKALDLRLAFMKSAKNTKTGALLWPTFGKGWQARVDRVRSFALQLAQSRPISRPDPSPDTPIYSDRETMGTPAGVVAILVAGMVAAAAVLLFKG